MNNSERTYEEKRHNSEKKRGRFTMSLYLVFAVAGLASFAQFSNDADATSAKVLGSEKAWQLKQELLWDQRTIHSLIRSHIVIDNVTDGTISGRIADANGTTIGIYGKESVILAQFGYYNGFAGKWQIVAKPSGGIFSFDIPEKYLNADYVKLWVNSNSFVIQPSTYSDQTSLGKYVQHGTAIEVNQDKIFVVHGAPPIASVDVSSDEGRNLQHFPVYQGQIDVTVTSASATHTLTN